MVAAACTCGTLSPVVDAVLRMPGLTSGEREKSCIPPDAARRPAQHWRGFSDLSPRDADWGVSEPALRALLCPVCAAGDSAEAAAPRRLWHTAEASELFLVTDVSKIGMAQLKAAMETLDRLDLAFLVRRGGEAIERKHPHAKTHDAPSPRRPPWHHDADTESLANERPPGGANLPFSRNTVRKKERRSRGKHRGFVLARPLDHELVPRHTISSAAESGVRRSRGVPVRTPIVSFFWGGGGRQQAPPVRGCLPMLRVSDPVAQYLGLRAVAPLRPMKERAFTGSETRTKMMGMGRVGQGGGGATGRRCAHQPTRRHGLPGSPLNGIWVVMSGGKKITGLALWHHNFARREPWVHFRQVVAPPSTTTTA